MADNSKLELVVEVDVNKANASIKSVNTGLSNMEQAATQAAHNASQGIDGMTASMVMGATSLVEGVPTTRIFAPAWGNSSLTGDTQVSYVGQASAYSPAIVAGLGGYVLV